jgi:hypothetical protein
MTDQLRAFPNLPTSYSLEDLLEMAVEETWTFRSRQVPQRRRELGVEKGKDLVQAKREQGPTGRNEEIEENHE